MNGSEEKTSESGLKEINAAIREGIEIGQILNDDSQFSLACRSVTQYQKAGKMRELATYITVAALTLLAVIVGAIAG